MSQMDPSRSVGQAAVVDRFTGGKSLGAVQPGPIPRHDHEPRDSGDRSDRREESEAARVHSKASTQRLHERINLLGQSKPPAAKPPAPPVVPQTANPNPPSTAENQDDVPPQSSISRPPPRLLLLSRQSVAAPASRLIPSPSPPPPRSRHPPAARLATLL